MWYWHTFLFTKLCIDVVTVCAFYPLGGICGRKKTILFYKDTWRRDVDLIRLHKKKHFNDYFIFYHIVFHELLENFTQMKKMTQNEKAQKNRFWYRYLIWCKIGIERWNIFFFKIVGKILYGAYWTKTQQFRWVNKNK